jgi:hypothetical protein
MNILFNLLIFALNYNEKKINNMDMAIDFYKINKIPAYMNIEKNSSGYDFRIDSIEELNNTILDSIQKYELLLKLESDKISIFEKISIIEELDKENNYGPNILNGGLLDNWNDVF